jgi:hypothetical protein
MASNLWGRISSLLILFFCSEMAVASSITVNPLTVVFETVDERYKDIKIFNTGDDTAYVNIELSKVVNPGTEQKELVQMKTDPLSFGLVASPNKLIIPPTQSRIVRLMRLLKNNETDGVYQVKIVPATGTLQAIKDGQENVVAGVKVVVGYNVSVRILPLQPEVNLTFERQGTQVNVTNSGNTSVLLSDGAQCDNNPDETKRVCQELPVKRVYAGSAWQFTLPFDREFSYQKTSVGQQEKVIIK